MVGHPRTGVEVASPVLAAAEAPREVQLFVAGSSQGRVAGWGVVLVAGGAVIFEGAGAQEGDTSYAVELRAVLEGLQLAHAGGSHAVEILVLNNTIIGLGQGWMEKWRARGWTKKGAPIQELDAVQAIAALSDQLALAWARPETEASGLIRARALARGAVEGTRVPPSGPPPEVVAYADGVTDGKRAAWAGLLVHPETGNIREIWASHAVLTEHGAQLAAAVEALDRIRQPGTRVELRSRSAYVRDVLVWIPAWRQDGWRRRTGDPLAHPDLVKRLGALCELHTVTFLRATSDDEHARTCVRLAEGGLAGTTGDHRYTRPPPELLR